MVRHKTQKTNLSCCEQQQLQNTSLTTSIANTMRQNPSVFLVCLILCLCLVPSNGFAFPGQPSSSSATESCSFLPKTGHQHRKRQQLTTLSLSKNNKNGASSGGFRAKTPSYGGYNDDAFGLVFLSGLALTQDVAFEVAFVGLSAVAAAATGSGIWNEENDARVPGAVAVAAIVLGRPLVGFVFLPIFMNNASTDLTKGLLDLPPFTAIPPPIEIGIVAISVAWAFFNWNSFKEDSSG